MKEEGAELDVVVVHSRRQGVATACLSMAAGHGPAVADGWLHWHGGSDRLQKISGPEKSMVYESKPSWQ